jgi:hypothetical protein
MTLDDVYGPGEERFPLEQDAQDWDEDLGLEWEETEAQEVCREIVSRH